MERYSNVREQLLDEGWKLQKILKGDELIRFMIGMDIEKNNYEIGKIVVPRYLSNHNVSSYRERDGFHEIYLKYKASVNDFEPRVDWDVDLLSEINSRGLGKIKLEDDFLKPTYWKTLSGLLQGFYRDDFELMPLRLLFINQEKVPRDLNDSVLCCAPTDKCPKEYSIGRRFRLSFSKDNKLMQW